MGGEPRETAGASAGRRRLTAIPQTAGVCQIARGDKSETVTDRGVSTAGALSMLHAPYTHVVNSLQAGCLPLAPIPTAPNRHS